MNIKKRFKAKAKQAWVRSNYRVGTLRWQETRELMQDDAFLTELERLLGGFPLRSFLPYSFF